MVNDKELSNIKQWLLTHVYLKALYDFIVMINKVIKYLLSLVLFPMFLFGLIHSVAQATTLFGAIDYWISNLINKIYLDFPGLISEVFSYIKRELLSNEKFLKILAQSIVEFFKYRDYTSLVSLYDIVRFSMHSFILILILIILLLIFLNLLSYELNELVPRHIAGRILSDLKYINCPEQILYTFKGKNIYLLYLFLVLILEIVLLYLVASGIISDLMRIFGKNIPINQFIIKLTLLLMVPLLLINLLNLLMKARINYSNLLRKYGLYNYEKLVSYTYEFFSKLINNYRENYIKYLEKLYIIGGRYSISPILVPIFTFLMLILLEIYMSSSFIIDALLGSFSLYIFVIWPFLPIMIAGLTDSFLILLSVNYQEIAEQFKKLNKKWVVIIAIPTSALLLALITYLNEQVNLKYVYFNTFLKINNIILLDYTVVLLMMNILFQLSRTFKGISINNLENSLNFIMISLTSSVIFLNVPLISIVAEVNNLISLSNSLDITSTGLLGVISLGFVQFFIIGLVPWIQLLITSTIRLLEAPLEKVSKNLYFSILNSVLSLLSIYLYLTGIKYIDYNSLIVTNYFITIFWLFLVTLTTVRINSIRRFLLISLAYITILFIIPLAHKYQPLYGLPILLYLSAYIYITYRIADKIVKSHNVIDNYTKILLKAIGVIANSN